jgi:hypothetical protein
VENPSSRVVCDHLQDERSYRSPSPRRGSHRRSLGVLASALLLTLLSRELALPSVAAAGSSEKRLLSITKTTVYGALLGGILGLAGALVVREGYEDDSIRWGVAVGAFSGFAYGALSHEDSDEFSLGPGRDSKGDGASGIRFPASVDGRPLARLQNAPGSGGAAGTIAGAAPLFRQGGAARPETIGPSGIPLHFIRER